MRIIQTHLSSPDDFKNQWERDQVYNGLDCCVTAEVLDALVSQLDNQTASTYAFSRALQGPALEMRLRGVRIDQFRKAEVIDLYFDRMEILERNFERIVFEGVGMSSFNWRSNADIQRLFYTELGIPTITKGGRPTVDRDALERLESYTICRQCVAHLVGLRELAKKIDVLRTEVDADGRMRTSYNIAGTSTGRFSSSFSEFGTGGNLQNIEENLRSIFIADKGMKMAKFDAKSGESFCVGAIEWNLFKDAKYLDACESGDPHTSVARICWPTAIPWSGDLTTDKELAEQPYYRHYSYRFMCKKLGHGSNYGGKPNTLAKQSKLPITVVSDFQPKYFRAFPAHLMWQGWVDMQLRKTGTLISLTGRKREFWGRRTDNDTLREAIAYDPQCSLADLVNTAMLRIWKMKIADLYMHDHDALTFQYPEELEDEIVPQLQKLLVVDLPLNHGRVLRIPYDAQTGWNRGKFDEKKNPDGLKDYVPGDKRKRTAEASLLDRVLR